MKLRAVTCNNFGCFYKRRGKLHAALQYLAKALKIELTSEEVDNPAGTHLNLCATLSQLGRHGPALEHAQCALELLEAMAVQKERKGTGAGKDEKATTDDGSILAIAWHNIAVEQEHLGMTDAALNSYEQVVPQMHPGTTPRYPAPFCICDPDESCEGSDRDNLEQALLVAEKEWGAGHIKTLAIKHSFEEASNQAAERRIKVAARAQITAAPGTTHASPLDTILNPAPQGPQVPPKTPSSTRSNRTVALWLKQAIILCW